MISSCFKHGREEGGGHILDYAEKGTGMHDDSMARGTGISSSASEQPPSPLPCCSGGSQELGSPWTLGIGGRLESRVVPCKLSLLRWEGLR